MERSSSLTRFSRPPERFPATQWTLVEAARRSKPDDQSLKALQSICLSYWYPLYGWARRSGWNGEDARDLIQSFFERLLEKGFLDSADATKGKLRTFLLTCLKRHGRDLRDKAWAAKRDARQTVSLDFEWAEGRCRDPADKRLPPDEVYDRQWAHTLLHYTLGLLQDEMRKAGKEKDFNVLKPYLGFSTDESDSYQTAADKLGTSEDAVKTRIFRLRNRYREILLEQARATLAEGEDPKAELLVLMGAV